MRLFLESQVEDEALPLTSEENGSLINPVRNRMTVQRLPYPFKVCFIFSMALNCILIAYTALNGTARKNSDLPITPYADLARNIPTLFNSSSAYGLGSPSETARSLLWESLDTSTGEISLENSFARDRDLPDSTPFFWDPSARSIYLLNAHHSLHCLRKIRRWVTLSQYDRQQLDSYPHLVHCMDHLLQNILCEADDTPIYTSPYANASTGLGQERMCRSWEKLNEWAGENTACFAYVNETQGVQDVIQRFRYCPKGSEVGRRMREWFNYPEGWWERMPEDVETVPRYWESFLGSKKTVEQDSS